MFSKLKKLKAEEKPSQQPKLCGMPALKQMRSSKREEYFSKKTKNSLPSLSDLEQQSKQDKESGAKGLEFGEEKKLKYSVDLVLTPNYKRPNSPSNAHDNKNINKQSNHVDRLGNGGLIYEEITLGDTEKSPEFDGDYDHESPTVDSPWRFSKGDSGYKSQNDGMNDVDRKKAKKSRRKVNSGKSSATSGLHDIKQQRKASRENVSQSMRALTPKERESIQFLEDVIKIADEHDSVDEVFDSESSGNDCYDQEHEFTCKKIEEDADEAIDYGYASVNDISRRYSVESTESVGSIIDLVGNLSTSPSSQTSPIYAVVDKAKKNREAKKENDIVDTDSTNSANAIRIERSFDDRSSTEPDTYWKSAHYENDFVMYPEDVITHLDEVINSFSIQSDDDIDHENSNEATENTEKKKEKKNKRQKSKDDPNLAEKENHQKDKNYHQEPGIDTTNPLKSSKSDGEKEIKKSEKKKVRDPEKEKERKERKKKRKEEKQAARNETESMEFADEVRLREENIARHVDTITALTQDMIKTAQKEEPIYAQVNKTKKNNKDINENIEYGNNEELLDPPSPFDSGPIVPSIHRLVEYSQQEENEKTKNDVESTDICGENPKFKHTSTPLSSPESYKMTHTSLQEESSNFPSKTSGQGLTRRATTDYSNYANLITPFFHKFPNNDGSRIVVSPSMLQESSENLIHVNSGCANGKSVQIIPTNSPREEDVASGSKEKDERFLDPSYQNSFYRHPPSTRNNSRPARPMSLNLDTDDKSVFAKANSVSVKPYSSFRKDRYEVTKETEIEHKTKPFVITTLKKSIELY